MSFKFKLFIGFFLFIVAVFIATLKLNYQSTINQSAVKQAQILYQQEKAQGITFVGQCLSNDLMPDWVVDIVHNPRTESDNNPSNQCEAYLNGSAHHFVELDTKGNLVRVQ